MSPATLDFGAGKTSIQFHIKNDGSATFSWNVTESPDKLWITGISPDQGTLNAGESETVTVTVDRNQLSGHTDTGTLVVNSNGGTQNVTVKIGEDGGVPIFPVATSPQSPGSEFWVDINVGTSTKQVTNLFGVTFNLNFTHTEYIDVVTPYSSNVIPGDFLGRDVVPVQNVDESSGKVSIGITKKSGQSGAKGYGTVAKVKFIAKSNSPNNTEVQFSISNATASDLSGNSISLDAGTLTVTIGAGLTVWPGDANNDNIVDQADVLLIGLYWGKTGLARPNASMMWMGQPATPWTPVNATYAHANGDAIVDQGDVLPIGLNWGKTHTAMLAGNMVNASATVSQSDTAMITLNYTGNQNPGHHFFIDVVAKDVNNLFGISYELLYTPTSFIDSLKVEIKSDSFLLGSDVVDFSLMDNTKHDTLKISVAITKKFGQSGVTTDKGLVTRIKAYMKPGAEIRKDITQFWFTKIVANDPAGNVIPFKVDMTQLNLVTQVETRESKKVPTEFALLQNFPNPFNPETTIEYYLPYSADVTLTVFDVQGRLVRSLVQEYMSAGYHTAEWNGRDESGQLVTSGVYFYRIEVNGKSAGQQPFVDVKKMLLIK